MNWNKYTQVLPVSRALLVFILFQSCSIHYSFQGGRLNYDMVKTITIHEFPVRVASSYPLLAQVFDQALQNRFIEQTRLTSVNSNGDIEIEGEITGYSIQGMAVQDNYDSRTRLTITVRVKYTNHKETNNDVDQTFSAYQECEPAALYEQQDDLVRQIVEELIDKIYNETVASW